MNKNKMPSNSCVILGHPLRCVKVSLIGSPWYSGKTALFGLEGLGSILTTAEERVMDVAFVLSACTFVGVGGWQFSWDFSLATREYGSLLMKNPPLRQYAADITKYLTTAMSC